MEPISMMLMIGAGLGLEAFGGMKSHSASKDYNAAQVQSIALQQQVEEKHRTAMELDARRKQLENLRQVQRASSLGLAASVNQGSQFSSGAAGGQSQVASQGAWNSTGISQNLQIGEDIFGLNSQISTQKIAMANAQQNMQTGQAISQFGGQLIGASGAFGRLTSGFGGTQRQSSMQGGMGLYGGAQTGFLA